VGILQGKAGGSDRGGFQSALLTFDAETEENRSTEARAWFEYSKNVNSE